MLASTSAPDRPPVTVLHAADQGAWADWLREQAAGLGFDATALLSVGVGENRVAFDERALAAPYILALITDGAVLDNRFIATLRAAIVRMQDQKAKLIPVLTRPRDDLPDILGAVRPLSLVMADEPEAVRLLARALDVAEPEKAAPYPGGVQWPGENPFPGLAAFSFEQAALFGGRDRDIAACLKQLARVPWLRIEGASGHGKSSLARAGVLPRLAAGHGDLPAHHPIVIRPSGTPLRSLARALADLDEDPAVTPDAVHADLLAGDAHRLAWWLDERLDQPVALLVDQFEEALRPGEDRALLRLDALLAAALPAGNLRLITTLRSDHAPSLTRMPALAARVAECAAQHLLLPMGEAALRNALDRPLAHHGLRWPEPELPARIVADALDRQRDPEADGGAVLPLVAHMAHELWGAAGTDAAPRLTLAAYTARGGVAGALAKSADRCLAGLGEADRRVAERVLLRLVRSGRGANHARAPMALDALVAIVANEPDLRAQPSSVAKVVYYLSGMVRETGATSTRPPRLVTIHRAADERTWVELIHEALLVDWPRLRGLIEQWSDVLERRAARREAASAWDAEAQKADAPDWLPKRARLAWMRGTDLEPQDQRRLAAGIEPVVLRFLRAADRELARQDAAEKETAESLRRRARVAVSAAVLLAIVAIGAGYQWRAAVRARQQADIAIGKALEVARALQRTAAVELPRLPGGGQLSAKLLDESADLIRTLRSVQADRPDVTRAAHVNAINDCEVLLKRGEVAAARAACRAAVAAARALVKQGVDGAEWDLAGGLKLLGGAERRAGRLAQARDAYERSVYIARRLIERGSVDPVKLRVLAVSLIGLGDGHFEALALVEARRAYVESLQIRRRLVEEKPDDSRAQRDLALCLNKVGDANWALKAVEPARASFLESYDIRAALLQRDPRNAGLKRDMAASLARLGDIATDARDVTEARRLYRESMDLLQPLADADARDAELRRNLAVAASKFGQLEGGEGNWEAARGAFRRSLTMRLELAELDPEDTVARADVMRVHMQLANVAIKLGQLTAARGALTDALESAKRLADLDRSNPRWHFVVLTQVSRLVQLADRVGTLADARAAMWQAGPHLAALARSGAWSSGGLVREMHALMTALARVLVEPRLAQEAESKAKKLEQAKLPNLAEAMREEGRAL